MKILVAGLGFVGLPHAAVCAEYGHVVYGYDIDKTRIAAFNSREREGLERYVREPGLFQIVEEYLGRSLFFVDEIESIIEDVEAIFLCVATPPRANGSTDLTYYLNAVGHLSKLLAARKNPRRVVLVNKSTVPIGTARLLQRLLAKAGVPNAGVVSNPEFLPEGNAVELSRKPDRVVVGADTPEDFAIMRRVYSQFINHVRIRYIETTPETSESIKYVANTLLLTYISFWNGVGARIGEAMPNVDMAALRLGVTSDERISKWGSFVSNGAGGSCFGKDIRSLIYQLGRLDVSTELLCSVYEINEFQKTYLIDRALHEGAFDFNGKTVALLGLSFKKRTADMRDSSAIKVVEQLLARGVKAIQAYDPMANEEARHVFDPARNHLFEKISYHESAREAISGTDALFICTDWEEFRGLSTVLDEVAHPPYLIIDGRRMIPDYRDLMARGYRYLAVGGQAAAGGEAGAGNGHQWVDNLLAALETP